MLSDPVKIGVVDLKAVSILGVMPIARTLDIAVGVPFDDGSAGYPGQKGMELPLDADVTAAM